MKKTLTVITLLAGAVSGYSQGEVGFNLYNGTVEKIAIFNQQAGATTSVTYAGQTVMETIGNTAASIEQPKGSTVYTGTGLSGTAFDVQLLANAGGSTSASAGWTPVSTIFNFKTGAATAGFMQGSQSVTLPTANAFAGGATASLMVAAWNNEGGTITSLAAAVAAGNVPWGVGNVVQFGPLAVSPSPTPALTGAMSFSLGSVPEPSTIALGVMGASTLLFRRRK